MVSRTFITALIGNIIAFVAGSALTWSSPMAPKLADGSLEDNPFGYGVSADQSSWISSLLALGAVFGPFVFGTAADNFGRKLTLLSIGLPFILSSLLFAFATTVEAFYVGRFLTGMSVGGVFTVIPMYIGEIAEDSNRGALGSMLNCFICSGLLFSYCVGPYIDIKWYNFILAVIPACYIVLFFFTAIESPQYFFKKGRQQEAEQSLLKLRGSDNPNNKKELEDIREAVEKAGHGTFFDIFRSKGLIKAFIISLALAGFQQLSGINAVLFFAQTIFQASGSSIEPAICSIIIGLVQFGTSFVTPLVADRLGRKILLIASAIGMFISEVPLGLFFFLKDDKQNVDAISWLPVVCLVLYIMTYNFGFGPLPWAVMGELFPSNVKSVASSSTASFCWILGFLITRFFQSLSDSIGMGESFWLFSGFCVIATLFSYFYVIETKGKSLQEIQDILES